MERRALLRKLVKQDPRSSIQFSDHIEVDGARFFKAAAEIGLEGIVSKRAASRYRSGDGVPWAPSADHDSQLKFAGPAILNPPRALRAA